MPSSTTPNGQLEFRAGDLTLTFDVYPWGTVFREVPAVYVLTQRVPRKMGDHRVLFLGETGNLAVRMRSHANFPCMTNGLIEFVGVRPVASTTFARELVDQLEADQVPPCNRCWPREPQDLPGCPKKAPPPAPIPRPQLREEERSLLDLQRAMALTRDEYVRIFGGAPETYRFRGSPRRLLLRMQEAIDTGEPIPADEFRDSDRSRRNRGWRPGKLRW